MKTYYGLFYFWYRKIFLAFYIRKTSSILVYKKVYFRFCFTKYFY